jgi:glycosyltransferase involved in cell wall biosynthesis
MGAPPIKLTVAVPTMRRWKGFLEKSLPQLLNNEYVHRVLICDETGEDIQAIRNSRWASHHKLLLHQNEQRLGMYANKRKCVELSPTDWVAVLDSDNIFPESFFEALFDTWKDEGSQIRTVYAASEIVRVFLKTGESEERTRHFSGMRIHKGNWNQTLNTKAWNFLLNDGNWVGHKSVLDAWPPIPEDRVKATDSIRIVKGLVENGWTYYIVPGMRYIHTVHDDSEWIKTEAESTRLLATTDWRIYA